jgi:putative ABC transport system permease protein
MGVLRDAMRAALRGAAARPGFAVLVVLTFAVGIGVNTAIFTVADASLRRGLPYPEPDRLMALFETRARRDFERTEASFPNYLDWRASLRSYDGIGAYNTRSFTLSGAGGAETIRSGLALGDFFRILGARPALGRLIEPRDESPAAERVAVLTNATWRSRFDGNPGVLGKKLTIDGQPAVIVGVLSSEFAFGPTGGPDLWMATRPEGGMRERRNLHWNNVVARLAPGVTREQAQAEATALAGRLAAAYPDANEGGGILIVPLGDEILGKVRPILLLLVCAAALVLLIACTNIANLLVARQLARGKELAVRAALGAKGSHLIALLTTEALLYALVGGALGVLLALWALDALVAAVPDAVLKQMPFLAGARIDVAALLLTFIMAVATGLAVGVVSALRAARPDLADVLRADGRASADPRRSRLRDALVVSEVALAFVLLAGAGLVARSLLEVLAVDPGFDARDLVTARINLPDAYDDARAVAAHDAIVARLAVLPGVRGAGSTNILPLGEGANTIRFVVDGRRPPPGQLEPEANIRDISPGYFAAMGIALREGRAFGPADRPESEHVVIVNKTLADRLFPRGALGQSIVFTFAPTEKPRRIVGVVGDELLGPLDQLPRPTVYMPYVQGPNAGISLVVRGAVSGNDIARAVRQYDADIPISDVATMEERMARAPWMFVRRFPALLVGAFAGLALLLTAIGIYGVLSYTVRQRTHEIGIRRAVGADRLHILHLVIGRSAALVGTGVIVGLVCALAGARLVSSLLFGVSPWDPTTLVAVAVGLLLIGLLASWPPARAALRVDPMEALRQSA